MNAASVYANAIFPHGIHTVRVTRLSRNALKLSKGQECIMTHARFVFSGETIPLSNGRVIVCGSRTSSGGRDKKHVFIEVECRPDDVEAVQRALAVILQQQGRINTSAF